MIGRKVQNESQVDVDMMDVRVEQITNGESQDNRGGQENIRIDVEGLDDEDENDVELSQKQKQIIDQLKQIIIERKTSDAILFKKVGKKSLRIQTERVNSAIRFVKTNKITGKNDIINATIVWVAQHMGLKKLRINQRKEPRWKAKLKAISKD